MRRAGSSRRPRCGHQLQRWPALAHPMAMQPQPQPLVAQDHRREPHLCTRSGMRVGRVAGQRDRCRPLPPLPVWVPTAVSASGLAVVAWPARRHPAGEKLQHFGGSGGVGRGPSAARAGCAGPPPWRRGRAAPPAPAHPAIEPSPHQEHDMARFMVPHDAPASSAQGGPVLGRLRRGSEGKAVGATGPAALAHRRQGPA